MKTKQTCANCEHWGKDESFGAYGLDFCCREDSAYYNKLVNYDNYCKAWEEREDAGNEP